MRRVSRRMVHGVLAARGSCRNFGKTPPVVAVLVEFPSGQAILGPVHGVVRGTRRTHTDRRRGGPQTGGGVASADRYGGQ